MLVVGVARLGVTPKLSAPFRPGVAEEETRMSRSDAESRSSLGSLGGTPLVAWVEALRLAAVPPNWERGIPMGLRPVGVRAGPAAGLAQKTEQEWPTFLARAREDPAS